MTICSVQHLKQVYLSKESSMVIFTVAFDYNQITFWCYFHCSNFTLQMKA